jgi:hypothetical protein
VLFDRYQQISRSIAIAEIGGLPTVWRALNWRIRVTRVALDVTATRWIGKTHRHRTRQQGQDHNRLFEYHSNAALAHDTRSFFIVAFS